MCVRENVCVCVIYVHMHVCVRMWVYLLVWVYLKDLCFCAGQTLSADVAEHKLWCSVVECE
jgi:hypothetical protein